MGQTFSTYVGIDAASGRKPFTFVAIDPSRKLRVVGSGEAVDVLSFIAGLTDALVALSPPWRGGRSASDSLPAVLLPSVRLSKLRQLSLLNNGQSEPCPLWMTASLDLLTQLQGIGYQPHSSDHSPLQWMEVPAETGYRSLLGVPPFESGTLEGRIQRQLVLYDLELEVPDAMEFFEEVTRFRLLHGHLPTERVLPQSELNAWMAAATAWLTIHEPGRTHLAGSPADGIVYYPIPKP